ncbi:hypothetical protein BDZ97DRAFT_1737598 [Flammula alnicola]|nr:hypothetical protein BDZ97DRAFT_1737598 [Flammula alnicola]
MAWLDDTNDPRRAIWMRGAAGAGKSAIARTIAQMCEKQGRMSSTFFFSRTSGDTRRSDEIYLVATLAYQMMENIPETRNDISTAMLNNEFIFNVALDVQIDRLIVAPLSLLSDLSSTPTLPKIIIIDGLDECHNKAAQDAIVKGFVAALARMNHNFPHKLLIASRPEQNIQSAFGDRDLVPFLRQLPLDNSWNPDDDIQTFLIDNLAKIRDTHPLRNIIPLDWPPVDDIDKLVEKSSGQFIYAATVSKYIKSPRLHPVTSLRIIVELVKDPKNRPYAALDALYTHIFASAEDPDLVLQILRIHFMKSIEPRVDLMHNEIRFMKNFLGLGEGDIELALSDLSSVVEIQSSIMSTSIKFLHASLPDFLMDESRAGKFYADSERIYDALFHCSLRCISEIDKIGEHNRDVVLLYFAGFQHFVGRVRAARPEIYGVFARCELKVLLKFTSDWFIASNETFRKYDNVHFAMAQFLRWILKEHKRPYPSETLHPLLKVIIQLQEWILMQLQKLPLDGPTSNSSFNINPLEIMFSDSELGFCWYLMSRTEFSDLFCDVELLGELAMNGYKYSYLAIYCYHYLFNNPIGNWYSSIKKAREIRVMNAAYSFLSKAAPRIDVCLSLHKIVGLDPTQQLKDLRQAPSLDDHRIHLVSDFHPHFSRIFHDVVVTKEDPSPDSLMKLLVDYSVTTYREFPSLVDQLSAHVQDGRNPASERKESDSASTWCETTLPQLMEDNHDAPLRAERHSVPSQERQNGVTVQDERRTVQDAREHAFRPKSRSNSPMTNASALPAPPRKRNSEFKSRIPVSKRRKQQK